MESLILASGSPRRREFLAEWGVPFEVEVAQVVEHEDPGMDPVEMVRHNAGLKAGWVAARRTGRWVLGADTTVFVDGVVLNKPADGAEARAMLRRLAGRAHTVYTGLALHQAALGVKDEDGEATEVVFRAFGEEVIEAYLARVNTLDKAGGYAIQEHGEMLVEGWRGSRSNVIGLPREGLERLLTRRGLGGWLK